MNRIVYAARPTWAEVALGLWIRVGIAGAFAFLASPALAFSGELAPLDALVVALAGAAAVALAWWRFNARLGAPRTPVRRLRPLPQA